MLAARHGADSAVGAAEEAALQSCWQPGHLLASVTRAPESSENDSAAQYGAVSRQRDGQGRGRGADQATSTRCCRRSCCPAGWRPAPAALCPARRVPPAPERGAACRPWTGRRREQRRSAARPLTHPASKRACACRAAASATQASKVKGPTTFWGPFAQGFGQMPTARAICM